MKKYIDEDGKEYEMIRTTNDWGEIYIGFKPVGEPMPEFDPFENDPLNSEDD